MTRWAVTLRQMSQIFNCHHLPWALFGGAAITPYQPGRRIRDIDILTIDSALNELAEAMDTDIHLDPYHQTIIQIAQIEIYGSLHIRSNLGEHVFTLDEAMIARREYGQLASIEVPLLSREDHLVLKAILQRDSQRGKLDIEDILTLGRVGALDTSYLRHRIELCSARGRADILLEELGILPPLQNVYLTS